MNPQYAPSQQYGAPPQNFPTNRASPSLGPPPTNQSFQNIPLGPQKPSGSPFPPANTGPLPNLYPSNVRSPIPSNQLPPGQLPPPSQLPPGQDQRPTNQFGPPPASKPGLIQNGPPQFMNGPRQFQNGTGFGLPPSQGPPTSQPQGPPLNKPPTGQFPSQQSLSGLPPTQHSPPQQLSSGLPPHPSHQQQPPTSLSQHQQPPTGLPPPQQQQQPGPPQLQKPPTGPPPLHQPQTGPPPLQQPPTGPPPFQQQPPRGPPPLQQQPSTGPAPLQQHPPTGPPPLQQHPPTGPPSLQQQLPTGPPSLQQQPPNGPPSFQQQPPSGPPPLQQQPPTGPPPLQQQPNIGLPPQQQLQTGHLPPPQQQSAGFPPVSHQQQQQPPPNVGFPQPQFSRPVQPSFPPLNQHPSVPGQPPLPGQPPHFGQRPPPNQFTQPPLPGGMPPGPGQPPLGPNQLTNQMQGMNLGGPHMPPPLSQQQYVNGQQQVRGPQGPPGYPPMPGPGVGPGAAPGLAGYPQAGYQQPQQAKRLDPDQMPSPIQVTQDDQQNRSGIFCTNQKGLVPPLVTTNFVVQDQGNASPRFIRSSMYNVPISQDIMKQTAVPFSLVISPMARTVDQEYPPPIVNFGDLGPVRCIRCKAYMCPFMQFIDSGRRFQCLFCKATTDVPNEYFQHLDHTGQRIDRYERPELVLGTYEFVATQEYCRNNTLPKPPAIVFVIDVSYNNIKSGLVHLLCSEIKEIIQHLPIDQGQEKSNMKVGFITYNSSVHFYNIKGNLAAPQMLIVGDIQEMFMPLLDGFLCTPEESGPVIDSLMQQIPQMFGETRETETILLPAILAGLEALKASDCAGKLLVFHSSLPTAEGPGKLKNRDDRKLLGTDKERTVLVPQTQAYNQLGQDCVGAGCSVDLFLFNNAYIDVATIGQVSRLTGGEVHKYTYFQADIDGERLIKDIITNISRPIAFDSIMRVRTSTGVRPTDFYGHFFMSNTTDMELAAIDCDKAIAVEIKHDDKLSEEEGVYIQAALLYTSVSGQRRLRVINLSLKTCSQMSDLYRNCDSDTIINYIAKQSTFKLFEHNPKAVKDSIVTRAAQILATYRKNCASPSSAGQLILPECMKLLPLYVNCLLKSDALSGGSDMTVDDRSFVMQEVMLMDIPSSVNYFYPRLIPLVDIDPSQETVVIPAPIRCTIDKMNEQGVYILENGIHMFLWIGLGANTDFIQQVFGVPSAIQVDIEKTALPELDNPLCNAVRSIIEEIRTQRHRYMRLTIVRQREKLEPVFKHFLAEDRGTDGSPSYVDFLIHMHKEIRSLLS